MKKFWTPDGFRSAEPPQPWALLEAEKQSVEIEVWLKAHEYRKVEKFGDESDSVQVVVWRYHTKHLYVELWNWNEQLCDFFVDAENIEEFFTTWYIQTLRDIVLANQVQILERMEKWIVAFIRHGHGEHVIDKYGNWTIDDQRAYIERQQQKRNLEGKR